MRTFKALGIVIGIYAVAVIAQAIMASSLSDYQGGITVLVIFGILGFLAPKVGYRWLDCFFAAIPLYGIFSFFRIGYRIAFLSERDWPERSTA